MDSPLPFNYFVKGAYDPSLYQASSQQPLAHLRTNRLLILLPTTQTQSYQLIFESTPLIFYLFHMSAQENFQQAPRAFCSTNQSPELK